MKHFDKLGLKKTSAWEYMTDIPKKKRGREFKLRNMQCSNWDIWKRVDKLSGRPKIPPGWSKNGLKSVKNFT